jgi:hypothetical protein
LVLVAVAVAIGAAACGPKAATVAEPAEQGPGKGPEAEIAVPAKDPLAAAVEQIVVLYEAIAKLEGPCREVAAAIEGLIGERTGALAQVRDAAQGAQAALVDGLFHDASPRLTASMQAVELLSTRCVSEPAVNAALARLSTEATR